jgi:hypothetical protein
MPNAECRMPNAECPMSPEASLLQKRVSLWLFEQLLREGIVPYAPIAPGEGVDATIRCADGTFRDLIVRPSHDEHFPVAFQAIGLAPRPRLLVVCVAWALSPVQCWVIPSQDFARHGVLGENVTTLDLEAASPDGAGKLKQTLSRYRNAWRLLTEDAVQAFVP